MSTTNTAFDPSAGFRAVEQSIRAGILFGDAVGAADRGDDDIADLEAVAAHALADLDDTAAGFVESHHVIGALRKTAVAVGVADRQIGAADSGSDELNLDAGGPCDHGLRVIVSNPVTPGSGSKDDCFHSI